MKETLLIKHAVGGRTFIDSSRQPVTYTVSENGGAWTFRVLGVPEASLSELLKWKHELNVFLFHEYEDQPTVKTWYYIKEGPVVVDADRQELTVTAQSRIEYVPDRFGMK